MRIERVARLFVVAAIGWIVAAPLPAQTPAGAGQGEKDPPEKTSSKKEKVKLEEVTRVSIDKALHSAAKEKSKPAAKGKKGPELSGESEVTEFHPAAPEEKNPGGAPTTEKSGKKSAAKNVHGTVYGAGGGQGTVTGGAVGTTTKTGKTSIYVQSEKSRTTNPPPH